MNPILRRHLPALRQWRADLVVTQAAFVAALLFAVVSPLSAADVAYYGIFKDQLYAQNDSGLPQAEPAPTLPFSFFTALQQQGLFVGQVSNPRLLLPNGKSQTLMLPPSGAEYEAGWGTNAASLAALDAVVPAGTYNLAFGTQHDGAKSLNLALPADQSPTAAHQILNWTEAQAVDPAKPFTLRWAPFVGGTVNDAIYVGVGEFRTAFYPGEPGFIALNGTATSVEIPAGSFAGPTSGSITFERDAVVDRTSYPGAIGLVGFSKTTIFYLNTLVEPSAKLVSRLASPGSIELTVSGPPGTALQIESSADLKVWAPVQRLEAPVTLVKVTYALAGGARFYRAQLLAPASPAGIWFGQFAGQLDNGGFGVLVSQDKQAVVVGYNTPQDEGVFKSGVAVGAGGAFDFISTQGSHIFGGFSGDSLSGNFVDLSGQGGTFLGTRQAADGAFAATAGYYTGSYSGALTGTARAIMSAGGKLFFYTSDITGDGGGFGQVNTQNQLTATTVAGASISGTLKPASLTLSGTYSIGGQVGGPFQLTRQFGP